MAASTKSVSIKAETKESDKPTTESSSSSMNQPQETVKAADVQCYLISNYRDALKKGDKSAAKSCLLAARYFSVNDPNVTNEIYIMAKSDGDVNEASKCFANIFNDLFLDQSDESSARCLNSSELLSVIGQMKEEIRNLLNELKSQYLKLKTNPAPASLTSRQAPSLNHTPMLSPRLRLSSEDRAASRDSVSKLDTHLHSLTRSLFYQQLFDNLPEATKRNILDHSIELCDNPYEKARLMMLAISMFSDSCSTYGSRLLRTLISLSTANDKLDEERHQTTSNQSSMMYYYSKSLLVLDAIPLVLDIIPISQLEVDIEELYTKTLNFYSEYCLEQSASEHEINELHEGMKKSSTAKSRSLNFDSNSQNDETIEEHLVATLNLLSRKFVSSLNDVDTEAYNQLKLHSGVDDLKNADKIKASQANTELMLATMEKLNLYDEIPDDILYSNKDVSGSSQVATPPPKSRGRPKKNQHSVAISADDAIKKSLLNKSKEVQFAFYTVLQHMFMQVGEYLKGTQSRILLSSHNSLADTIVSDPAKGTSQRSSRSKSSSQQSSETSSSPIKKQKLEQVEGRLVDVSLEDDSSDLGSALDNKTTVCPSLWNAHKCFDFLTSNHGSFTRLWNRYLILSNVPELNWYRRFSVDRMLILGQYEKVSELLEIILDTKKSDFEVKKDQSSNGTSTLTISAGPPTITAMDLRNLIQLISCNIQRSDRTKSFNRIDEFINKMRQAGLFADDVGSSIEIGSEDYKLTGEKGHLGFLHFDASSMVRYCARIFMTLLKRQLDSNVITDSTVGHTIVMSQFDWPKEARIYDHCINWLRIHKPKSTTPQCLSAATKFTYPNFFQYIRNPNIIEDFMAMLSQGYTLDIKGNNMNSLTSSSSSNARGVCGNQGSGGGRGSSSSVNSSTTRSGKAITTRGVNKSFKEDLKIALISQMRSSTLIVSLDTISEFMQTSLIPHFNSIKR